MSETELLNKMFPSVVEFADIESGSPAVSDELTGCSLKDTNTVSGTEHGNHSLTKYRYMNIYQMINA